MPSIYLSPSTQEYNPFVTGTGSEEYYTNLIADAMVPYLRASGISFTRNNPGGTVVDSIAAYKCCPRKFNRSDPGSKRLLLS